MKPSDIVDRESSKDCDGVGKSSNAADIRLLPSWEMGEPTRRLLELAELIGREKFIADRAFDCVDLFEFREGDRSWDGLYIDADDRGNDTPLLEDNLRGI
jgi:hypothetical protein